MSNYGAAPLAPERFVITAISPERQKPEFEVYRIEVKLSDGTWGESLTETGVTNVRFFLYQNGISQNDIDRAIEELIKTGRAEAIRKAR